MRMTDPDDLKRKVIEFCADFSGTSKDEISLATTLRNDLGIEGADASEFFERFAQEFDVDLAGFRISNYFGPEGCNPLTACLVLLGIHRTRFSPITVERLVLLASKHKWLPLN